jgi:hypothetical protein
MPESSASLRMSIFNKAPPQMFQQIGAPVRESLNRTVRLMAVCDRVLSKTQDQPIGPSVSPLWSLALLRKSGRRRS